ncbi:hypothetical protein LTR64_000630 [Lithohypha guttulata]|uniref:uncharacterized protein n=1 Tax=Lithohypha guttulata TaxID=1690604 RepID=UPI002DDFB516|nr:hypothetical protein LTR51_005602 [Lithohypha guttulata]
MTALTARDDIPSRRTVRKMLVYDVDADVASSDHLHAYPDAYSLIALRPQGWLSAWESYEYGVVDRRRSLWLAPINRSRPSRDKQYCATIACTHEKEHKVIE